MAQLDRNNLGLPLPAERLQRVILEVVVNPVLRSLVDKFDLECPRDGSLLLNSLKLYLGESVVLCRVCRDISEKIAKPFYDVGSRLLRLDKAFVKNNFLKNPYGEAWLKGFGLMMKGIRRYGIQRPFTPAGPFEVVWNYTYQCNLGCKHCYEDAGKKLHEMSLDEAKQTVDILSKIAGIGLPALSFSGGEPLMRKDFFEVAAYAKEYIPYVSIATNGTLITKDIAKRLREINIDYVEISLDGATKQTHESFRRVPGCFEKTMDGIRNCIDEGIDTCIATTIHRENLSEFEKLLDLAKELNVRFIHFNYIPTGRAKAFVQLDLTPEERLHVLETLGKEILDLYLKAKEEEEKFGRTEVKIDKFFSTCPQYASVVKRLSRQRGEKFAVAAHYAAKRGVENLANFLGGCGAGRLYCCLEPNGDIKPCVFFPTNGQTVLGNILKDNFQDIWDDDPLLWKLRSRDALENYLVNGKTVGCGVCSDKYVCGGCRARAYSYFNGNINAPDVGCIMNLPLWKKIVGNKL